MLYGAERASATVLEVEGEPPRLLPRSFATLSLPFCASGAPPGSQAHLRSDLRSWRTWCRCDQVRH